MFGQVVFELRILAGARDAFIGAVMHGPGPGEDGRFPDLRTLGMTLSRLSWLGSQENWQRLREVAAPHPPLMTAGRGVP